MTVTALPIWMVDIIGAVAMIVLAFLCIRHARQLCRRDPGNVIWTYLSWVSYCLAGFAVSRSAGHILKQLLIFSQHSHLWKMVQPYSGSINTFLLIIVAAITLFFSRVWRVYQQITEDQAVLTQTHAELIDLNETLEKRVTERTRALALSEKQIAQADKLASIGQLSSGIAHESTTLWASSWDTPSCCCATSKRITRPAMISGSLKNMPKPARVSWKICSISPAANRRARMPSAFTTSSRRCWCSCSTIRAAAHMIIEKDFAADMPQLTIDDKKIKQVFINLLMNAQHANGNRGKLKIVTRHDVRAGNVTVRVEDEGYGIAADDINRIFDPFFTTKPTGEGTGLGLAVSYGIVKSHGGDISVTSRLGQGACFTVTLPVIDA
jgi:two-component system NtrC family sensor kinase